MLALPRGFHFQVKKNRSITVLSQQLPCGIMPMLSLVGQLTQSCSTACAMASRTARTLHYVELRGIDVKALC